MRRAVVAVAPALILALTLLLTACASAPLRSFAVNADAESAWQVRQAALTAVSAWTLAGRIAAHNGDGTGGAGADGAAAVNISATLHWAQQASGYTIDVIAPFGQGAIRLEGNSDGVMLRLADGRQLNAANPDSLLYDHTGLHLPITSLRFWVLGVPDPTSEARKAIDDTGRTLWLEQSGWRIEFLRYSQVNGLDLPGKLVITNPPMHMRLVIDRWELSL